jgi:hypothetical protein
MAKKFDELVLEIVKAIGEVEGTSVNTYSIPRVESALRQIFDIVFRKTWWPQYCKWYQMTLDGSLGIFTSDLTGIKDFRDIRVIMNEKGEHPIPQLPKGKNPFNITGDRVAYYEPLDFSNAGYATRLVQFWPKTAKGNIVVHGRLYPTIVGATELFLDQNMLINGAAWIILDDEGINPEAAQLRKDLFEESWNAYLQAEGDQPIENWHSPGGGDTRYYSEWQVNP